MRKAQYRSDFLVSENRRIVLKVIRVDRNARFPEGIEFAIQYLYWKDGIWHQVARIDNQLHGGKPGIHLHTLEREKVEWLNISFQETRTHIMEVGERIIRTIIERV